MRSYQVVVCAAVALAAFASPAFAGFVTPGPVAGVGWSALAILGGVYWVARRVHSRKR